MLKRLWERFVELLKAASDRLIAFLLQSTSRFGRELTDEGEAEQAMWRELRLRDLRGLALISRRKRMEPNE